MVSTKFNNLRKNKTKVTYKYFTINVIAQRHKKFEICTLGFAEFKILYVVLY